MTKIHAAIACILLVSTTVKGDDLRPPSWRGTGDTTFQHWWFPNNDSSIVFADEWTSDFGEPGHMTVTGNTPPDTEWRDMHEGREGVWRLSSVTNAMMLCSLHNYVRDEDYEKFVWVQVTYHAGTAKPNVAVAPGGFVLTGFRDTALGDGWVHSQTKWRSSGCDTESVFISPPAGAVSYVDQVVVDTSCHRPVPVLGPFGLLALAGALGLAGSWLLRSAPPAS